VGDCNAVAESRAGKHPVTLEYRPLAQGSVCASMLRRRGFAVVIGLAAAVAARCALAVCPGISSISPSPYIVGSGQKITISGSGFCATSGCNSVTINGVSASVVTGSRSSSGLKVDDPGLVAGASYDVAVTQSTCAVAHTALTYQNPTPTISSVIAGDMGNWGSTVANGMYTLTITGTNFVAGATYSIAGFGSGATTFVSATQLSASIYGSNWAPGTYSFTVKNPGPNTPTGSYGSGFQMVTPPTISSVVPNTAAAGSATSFTVNGANLGTLATYTTCAQLNGVTTTCSSLTPSQIITQNLTVSATPGSYLFSACTCTRYTAARRTASISTSRRCSRISGPRRRRRTLRRRRRRALRARR
jgi:hypothetical protein